MKKNYLLILLLLTLYSCNENKKEKNIIIDNIKESVFILKGNVNLPDKSIIILEKQNLDKSFKEILKTQVNNNKFEFSKNIDEAELLFINFKNNDIKIPFIANNSEIFVNINIDDIDNVKIKGNQIQDNYSSYLKELEKAENKFVFKTDFIKNNSTSILSAIILKQMLGKTKWRIEQNKKAFETLSDNIKKTNLGIEINNFIKNNEPLVKEEKAVAELSLDPKISNETTVEVKPIIKQTISNTYPNRKKAPNFYAESINGNDISLNSILKNNKVVLIDFWASWCAPCRAESPNIIRLYNKYHAKGFDVIGVSEDKYADTDKWKNAVAIDRLPWHQVIDDNRRVAKMFGVSSIPHTVLIDGNGGLILNKKTSYTIEAKLKEIFGY